MNHLTEAINGAWVLLAISLATLSIVYLRHEIRARGAGRPWTSGMRAALAKMLLSIGVGVAHFPLWEWRHFAHTDSLDGWRITVMATGAFIGACGFLISNREVSRALYGNGPWMVTAAVVTMFLAATAISYW